MFHVFAHAFKLKRLYIYHTATSLGSSEFRRSFRHHSDFTFPWDGVECRKMPASFGNLRLATMKPNFGSNYGK
jgi:hypothetical protein